MIALTFACGHTGQISETATTAPICPECGDAQVSRVKARAPRFTGACSGPFAEMKYVEPAVVNVAPGGPLKLKAQES